VFCASLDYFGFVLPESVLLGIVFFPVLSRDVGWKECLRNELFRVEGTYTRSSAIAEGPRGALCQLKSCHVHSIERIQLSIRL